MNVKKIIFTLTLFIISCKQKTSNLNAENLLLVEQLELSDYKIDSLNNGVQEYTSENKIFKKGNVRDGYKTGLWNYKINNESHTVYWLVEGTSNIKFNYPKSWKLIENDNYLVYSILNKSLGDFFLIKKQEKTEHQINLTNYYIQARKGLKKSFPKDISGFSGLEISSEKKDSYYMSFETVKENINVTYYIFYTEDSDYIYDFTFRISGERKGLNKEIFVSILSSFTVDNQKLFYDNDEIISYKQFGIID